MKKLLILLLTVLLLVSCGESLSHKQSLTVDTSSYASLDDADSCTWYVSVSYYANLVEIDDVKGGTSGWTEVDIDDGSLELSNLTRGYWIIQVKALDSDGSVVYYGSAVIYVDGSTSVTVDVEDVRTESEEESGGTGDTGGEEETEETGSVTFQIIIIANNNDAIDYSYDASTCTFEFTCTADTDTEWMVNNTAVDDSFSIDGLEASVTDGVLSVTVSDTYAETYFTIAYDASAKPVEIILS